MNRKLYTFENCPGIVWEQRELTYPQFEKIKNDFVGFLQSLSPESDLIIALNQFIDSVLKETISTLIIPHSHTNLWKRFVQWFNVRQGSVNIATPAAYMTLSEVAGVVNDFFFLNRLWMDQLKGSAANVGGILNQLMGDLLTMTPLQVPPKSSGSSPTDETQNSNN